MLFDAPNAYPVASEGSLWVSEVDDSVWRVDAMMPASDGNPSLILVRLTPGDGKKRLAVTARWLVERSTYTLTDDSGAQAIIDKSAGLLRRAQRALRLRPMVGKLLYLVMALCVAAVGFKLATMTVPAGTPRMVAYVLIVAVSLSGGGFLTYRAP